jgi:Uma2 family endonuclease
VIKRSGPPEQVLSHPPLAVIEILSGEDRFSATMEKLGDYLRFGIENIWIIDPEPRLAYRYTSAGLEDVHSGELTVPETPIRVVLSELFAELDRA